MEVIPISTAYAACVPNNFADTIDGQTLVEHSSTQIISTALLVSMNNATTPLQCCIDSVINPICVDSTTFAR
jgi:hypothetical protein